ncbi:hypothetical protein E3P92_04034 [Wallemia ichthyophaga]|uniref:Glutathione S-transferase n=2 Tax=Wallemia ichthyophaga TaxID=245174 RepID=A0A4V4M6G1_WALIC|nr:hypothetical protein E3P93_04018 [Wallemia ichthyophaga]TIB07467.1 hypothetical protein E3P92_04034 [Wallemia ichthyophaga]TIB07623.1 hypothetical protein E3P90_04015 [Wallemia ichthyophaga]TIB19391.1 hypothetical protein E3P89_04009 [Wallemia ichthyophaga]TIB20170.1 hypothetical protein E3P88_04021 [Wallemia ichthyophaga]
MAPAITLYACASGPNPPKVAYLLEELGISYDIKSLVFGEGDENKPGVKGASFLKINPNGRVPAIVDHENNDFCVWESGAILQYLAETKKGGDKYIGGGHGNEKYEVLTWLAFQISGHGPMQGQVNYTKLFFKNYWNEECQPSVVKRFENETYRVFSVLESRLKAQKQAGSDYIAGKNYSIADMSFHAWLRIAAFPGLDLSGYPTLKAYMEHMEAKQSTQAATKKIADACNVTCIMQSLEQVLSHNSEFCVARRRWGYDHDLYQGSSLTEALKRSRPKVFSVEMAIFASRVTIYHNTDASTRSANADEYAEYADNDTLAETLVDSNSIVDKDSLYKDADDVKYFNDSDSKSTLSTSNTLNKDIIEIPGKQAISTSHRSKYMRSRYTVAIVGHPGEEITLNRGSHYFSIKKKFTLNGKEYLVEGKKFDVIISNIATGEVLCRYQFKTFAKHKSGVLIMSMPVDSVLYERIVVFTVMMVELKFLTEAAHATWEGLFVAGVNNSMAKATSSRIKDERE